MRASALDGLTDPEAADRQRATLEAVVRLTGGQGALAYLDQRTRYAGTDATAGRARLSAWGSTWHRS